MPRSLENFAEVILPETDKEPKMVIGDAGGDSEKIAHSAVSSESEDWENLYEDANNAQYLLDSGEETAKMNWSDQDLGHCSGHLVDNVLNAIGLDDSSCNSDDSDMGFTVVKSKGTKARERRKARRSSLIKSESSKRPLYKKEFSVFAKDKHKNMAVVTGNSYVNVFNANVPKVQSAFHSVDNQEGAIVETPLPSKQLIFGLAYSDMVKGSIYDDYAEKPGDENSVIFESEPIGQRYHKGVLTLKPVNSLVLSSSDEDDDFFGASKKDVQLVVEIGKDRKERRFKQADEIVRSIKTIPNGITTWSAFINPPPPPPGILITEEERKSNLTANQKANESQIFQPAPSWVPKMSQHLRVPCKAYSDEVNRAMTVYRYQPPAGSDAYNEFAQNYAVYGKDLLDFPKDYALLFSKREKGNEESGKVDDFFEGEKDSNLDEFENTLGRPRTAGSDSPTRVVNERPGVEQIKPTATLNDAAESFFPSLGPYINSSPTATYTHSVTNTTVFAYDTDGNIFPHCRRPPTSFSMVTDEVTTFLGASASATEGVITPLVITQQQVNATTTSNAFISGPKVLGNRGRDVAQHFSTSSFQMFKETTNIVTNNAQNATPSVPSYHPYFMSQQQQNNICSHHNFCTTYSNNFLLSGGNGVVHRHQAPSGPCSCGGNGGFTNSTPQMYVHFPPSSGMPPRDENLPGF